MVFRRTKRELWYWRKVVFDAEQRKWSGLQTCTDHVVVFDSVHNDSVLWLFAYVEQCQFWHVALCNDNVGLETLCTKTFRSLCTERVSAGIQWPLDILDISGGLSPLCTKSVAVFSRCKPSVVSFARDCIRGCFQYFENTCIWE